MVQYYLTGYSSHCWNVPEITPIFPLILSDITHCLMTQVDQLGGLPPQTTPPVSQGETDGKKGSLKRELLHAATQFFMAVEHRVLWEWLSRFLLEGVVGVIKESQTEEGEDSKWRTMEARTKMALFLLKCIPHW